MPSTMRHREAGDPVTAAAGDAATDAVPGSGVLDLQGYVPYFLTAISNAWSRSSSRLYLERFGVGVTEWRVISQLAIEPSIAAQRICEVIGLDKGAVSRSVAALVAAGHVTEEPDPRDARRQVLTLTPGGYALHDRLIALAMARERLMLAGFSELEREQFTGFLRRLHERLPELRDFRPPVEEEGRRAYQRPKP